MMERYSKTIRFRMILLAILALISVAFGIYDVFFAPPEIKDSAVFGFQCGAVLSLGLMAVLILVRYERILKDKAKLQLQFNKENDERAKAIRAKASMPMLLITSILMMLAGIIASYFSITVFATLIIAGVSQMLIGVVVKLVYTKKM